MEEGGCRTFLVRGDWVTARKVQELRVQDEREYAGLLQRLECKDLKKYGRCKSTNLGLNRKTKGLTAVEGCERPKSYGTAWFEYCCCFGPECIHIEPVSLT